MRIPAVATGQTSTGRWAIVRALLALNIVALTATYFSGQWDAAEHAKGAVDRFWYPPHFGIYFGLLAAAILAGIGLSLIVRGAGSPAAKLRRSAALTLVVVANVLDVTGAPFDAWWHATFGIDLTVWSPPHLHILVGMVIAALACAVYWLDDEPLHAPLRLLRSLDGRGALAIVAMLLALLIAGYIFFEYEAGAQSADVLRRPEWTYPVLWSAYTLFMLVLFTSATRRIGTATLITALFLGVRLLVLWLDRALLDYQGPPTYPLVVPALALDLLLLAGRHWIGDGRRQIAWALVSLPVAGLLALTTPLYWQLLGVAPNLDVLPWARFWPIALVAGMLGALAGRWCGTGLRRLRPATPVPRYAPLGRALAAD